MGKIKFHKHVQFSGFNLGQNENISYPENQTMPSQIDDVTDNSIAYSFVNSQMVDKNTIFARYQSNALSRDQYIVYKIGIDNKIKTCIGAISDVKSGFWDYNISSGEKYKYIVETSPKDLQDNVSNSSFVSLETQAFVSPKWAYWSICDIDKMKTDDGTILYIPSDVVYIMKNNLEPGSINDNLSVIKYNTLGKYGIMIQNHQKFDTGSMSCIIEDFMLVQDISSKRRIYVDKSVNNSASFDNFFASIEDKTFSDDVSSMYFLFPNYSDEYYECTPTPVLNYFQLPKPQNDEYGVGQPSDWNEKYYMYYYDVDGKKVKIDKYQLVEDVNPNIKTDTTLQQKFKDEYNQYYKILDTSVSKENYQYIRLTEAEDWRANTYYTLSAPVYDIERYTYYRLSLKMQNVGVAAQRITTIKNDITLLNQWRDFVSNGKEKLLKAPNGQKWIVAISDANTLDVAWHSSQHISTIGFNWQEIANINDVSIMRW